MKVSELTGAKLDYWVAKAMDLQPKLKSFDDKQQWVVIPWALFPGIPLGMTGPFQPSTNHAHGWPLVDQEGICTADNRASYSLQALFYGDGAPEVQIGATRLEAAMRCLVANKYGNEVPDAN